MAWGDGFYRKAEEKVQDRVGEPVEVIGWASRTGAMGALVASELLAGAGAVAGSPLRIGSRAPSGRMLGPGGEKGAKLPLNFLVAVTPSSVRAFGLRKTWFGLKLKRELGVLPRAGITLESADSGLTKRFHLAGRDGSALAFEMTRSKWTTRFADQLEAALI
jgi:hypothetical protein